METSLGIHVAKFFQGSSEIRVSRGVYDRVDARVHKAQNHEGSVERTIQIAERHEAKGQGQETNLVWCPADDEDDDHGEERPDDATSGFEKLKILPRFPHCQGLRAFLERTNRQDVRTYHDHHRKKVLDQEI